MNKRQIFASLNKIANELDTNGLFKEANEVTEVMVKLSQSKSIVMNSSFGTDDTYTPGISSMIPSMQKPYEAQGPLKNTGKNSMEYAGYVSPEQKKAMNAKNAQQYINSMSVIFDGDIETILKIAKDAKVPGLPKAQDKLLNDVIYILNLRTNKGLGAERYMDRNPELGPGVGLE